MPKLYTINNTLVSINGYYLGQFDRYDVTVASSEHGSVVATPSRGLAGTTITLSSTADAGYELDYYTVNGVAIVGNTFTLTGNATVAGVFVQAAVEEVTIGTQTWKTSYVEFNDGGDGIYYSEDTGIYYYEWSAISRIITSLVGTGYHVPSKSDFETLMNYVGNDVTSIFNSLASTSGWTNGNGLNTSGFNAEAHGYHHGGTYNVGSVCYLATSESRAVWGHTSDIPFYLTQTTNPLYGGDGWFATFGNVPMRLIKDS